MERSRKSQGKACGGSLQSGSLRGFGSVVFYQPARKYFPYVKNQCYRQCSLGSWLRWRLAYRVFIKGILNQSVPAEERERKEAGVGREASWAAKWGQWQPQLIPMRSSGAGRPFIIASHGTKVAGPFYHKKDCTRNVGSVLHLDEAALYCQGNPSNGLRTEGVDLAYLQHWSSKSFIGGGLDSTSHWPPWPATVPGTTNECQLYL